MLRIVYFAGVIVLSAILGVTSAAQDSGSDSGQAPPANVLPATYDTYIVQRGDSLYSIAEQFHTTIADLRQINESQQENRFTPVQSILLPTGIRSFVEVYLVQPGDTLFGISKRFNTSVGIIQGLNEISDSTHIEAGQSLVVRSINEADVLMHVVGPKDTLFSISRRYHTTVSTLKSLNGIADERELVLGRVSWCLKLTRPNSRSMKLRRPILFTVCHGASPRLRRP